MKSARLLLAAPACWLAAVLCAGGQDATPPPLAFSPVILTENPDVVQRFAVNASMARSMVDRALLKLTSADDLGTAWTRLGITPQDVVGIKITTIGGPLLCTHWAIVQAICEGLQAAGVAPSHIIVWDKVATDMISAGYQPAPGTDTRPGIASVFPGTGYDPATFYKSNILGTLIWGDSEFVSRDPENDLMDAARNAVKSHEYNDSSLSGGDASSAGGDILSGGALQTSTKSFYATLVSQLCTKLINVPVLSDNSSVGLNGCLASLALGCIDNNRRFQGDPTYGDPAICEILDRDFMRHKVVIHILDALVAEYAGGPVFDPQFTEPIGAIYVSRDPVAIDSLVLPRLERWRKLNHIDPIGAHAAHVHDAANYHLGTDDPGRIQLVRLP